MTISPPAFASQLSLPIVANNFIALQSAQLAVTNASGSVTFTNIFTGGQRLTAKITNTGTNGAYLASGKATATAVVSTSTPQPTSGTNAVSNCDFIAQGAILQQDFIAGTDTLAAICAGSGTTTLEISVGTGQ